MSNFSKMLAVNQKTNLEKENRAKREIAKMLDSDIQVTVAELVSRTGLSRAFFYKNPAVAEALRTARESQKGRTFTRPAKVILDKAMDKQIELLKKENERLKEEISLLRKENENLKVAVNKKALKVIKGL